MSGRITIVGLGPGDLEGVSSATLDLLLDPGCRVIVRTLEHPAARQLAERRRVESGDDLYQQAENFDDVYRRLADRVVEAAGSDHVVFAVPGSPMVGERTPLLVRARAGEAGIEVRVVPERSFLDEVLAAVEVDPIADGLVVLDGHHLPDPLLLRSPTVITQLDTPMVLGDVRDRLTRILPEGTPVTLLSDLGSARARIQAMSLSDLQAGAAGPRTSLYLRPPEAGLAGLIGTMRQLRAECPWDRQQTHQSLVRNLVEEAFELVEAIAQLPPDAPGGQPDFVAYENVEDELGDLLLQVLFHSTMAREARAFDIEDVAERLRDKLVRRHPHVFGDTEVESAQEVLRNWERIKQEEKRRQSLMDDIPAGLPGMERAAKLQRRAASVGFDWPDPAGVLDKVREEVGELGESLEDRLRSEHEIGDLLFSVVNLARHLHLDTEVALRRAADRFEERFRRMESSADLERSSPAQMDELWQAAKAAEGRLPPEGEKP